MVPTGTLSTTFSPSRPVQLEPSPWRPRSDLYSGLKRKCTSVLCRCDDSIITSPPRPPSPPDGPPRGTNFSRRKAMQPLPPSPAFTRILASSINICPSQSTESSTLHSRIQDVSKSIGKSRVPPRLDFETWDALHSATVRLSHLDSTGVGLAWMWGPRTLTASPERRPIINSPTKLSLLLLIILIFTAFPQIHAQSDTGGSVAGQISGISGNHFRAIVTLRNTATGDQLQAPSDTSGNFRFAEVAPGLYAARINAPGTAPWHAYDITVEVGRTTFLAPHMTVAFFDHPVRRRTNYAPLADLTPSVSNNIDETFIDSLPSPSGHWSAFAALASGVAPDSDGSSALSFRGLSPLMNDITLDGVDNTIAFRGRERGTSVGGYSTARGAVSQFRVSTSNFSAEYGRAAGGVISSVTRSGSNTLHVTASFRDRDAAWGAANAFARIMQPLPLGTKTAPGGAPVQILNGQPITYVNQPYNAPDRRLQFGFHAGGPIRRDKLFWFFAGDYYSRNHPATARAREPELFFAPPSTQPSETLAARISTSTNPIFTGCAATSPDLNGQAACAYESVLNQLDGLLGNVPRTSRQMIFFPKIDWRANSRIHLIGQYNVMHRDSPN